MDASRNLSGVLLLACIGLSWHAMNLSNRLAKLEAAGQPQASEQAAVPAPGELVRAMGLGVALPHNPRLDAAQRVPRDSIAEALAYLYRWAYESARAQQRLNRTFRDKLEAVGQRVTPVVPAIPPWTEIPPSPQRCFPPNPCPPN